MELLITIMFSILWGYICYRMAKKRHRDTTLAAILGAIFGVLAVVGYAIVGNKED